MWKIGSHLTVLARGCNGPLVLAAVPSSTGLKPLSYTKREYATLDFEERIYGSELVYAVKRRPAAALQIVRQCAAEMSKSAVRVTV